MQGFHALVDPENDHVVQIWGSDLYTSVSGAPVSTSNVGNTIVSTSWDRSGTQLCVSTSSTIMILAPRNLLSEKERPWEIIWQYDWIAVSPREISQVQYVANSVVLSSSRQLASLDCAAWHQQLPYTGPLPIYHPTVLRNLMLFGYLNGCRTILAALYDQLVNSSEEVALKDDLGLASEQIFANDSLKPVVANGNRYGALFGEDENTNRASESGILSATKASSLSFLVMELPITTFDESDKRELAVLSTSLVAIESKEASLDAMGLKYFLSYSIMREYNDRYPDATPKALSDADIMWASLSTKQDILINLIKDSAKMLTWQVAKTAKIFFWLQDRSAISEVAETVAKAEFLKGEDRDPVPASLWYFALRKKSTLLSLWRMSSHHPEHALTSKILANDFDLPKWRTTANKNAYALVGRRRYQYAAAWFLLADSLKDAVHICIRNLEDLDLAVAIARIYEDDRGKTVRALMENQVHAHAKTTGSRFLAVWSTNILKDQSASLNLLTEPFGPTTRDTPELVPLYLEFRDRLGSSEKERVFVEYCAHLLDMRGCHVLANNLLTKWEHQAPSYKPNLVTQNEVSLEDYKSNKQNQLVEAPKAMFEEPTMDSFAAFDF